MGGATFDVPQGGTNQRDGLSIPITRSSVQASPASRLHATPANTSCQFGSASSVCGRFLGLAKSAPDSQALVCGSQHSFPAPPLKTQT